MSNEYLAYLKDRTVDGWNGGGVVDMATFHSDDPEAAELIAQARFAEELKDTNKFLFIDVVPPGTCQVFIDEGE